MSMSPTVILKIKINKNFKNGILAKKNNGATGLNFGMQTQLDSANNMG